MKLSDVDKAVESIRAAKFDYRGRTGKSDAGLDHALNIVLKVQDKLRKRRRKL
jgi:hypothetical protein